MTENLVIDAHADTLLKLYFGSLMRFSSQEKDPMHITKAFLEEGKVNVQVFAMFVPPKLEKIGLEVTLEMIQLAKEKALDENFTLIKSANDLDYVSQNKESTTGMVLSIEGAIALERNLKILPSIYELGVRNIGITWSRQNLFGEGVSFTEKKTGRGLSKDGIQLLEEMDKLGMLIDVAHLNYEGYMDVMQYAEGPFIDSHSNAHSICPVSRNLTDDQLEMIASADGVVGVNFYPKFLSTTPEKVSIDDVIKHIKYITDLIGTEHVGLGSDFDGIGTTPLGLEDARKMKDLVPLLEKEGFSKNEIEKIIGGNFDRIFRKTWK
ncbi:MAG: dipeptidase [Candidatus Hodarchaeales archaeon]|jgi:membrane dipeptidase